MNLNSILDIHFERRIMIHYELSHRLKEKLIKMLEKIIKKIILPF